MEQLLRPYGVVIDGELELGLELILSKGIVKEIRPHTGIPELHVISPAFVNAHSHLEYRGLQGKLHETDYWPWIREITLAKRSQRPDDVQESCYIAARENRSTGVAAIAEHADRPYSGEAMWAAKLSGVIFQEVITRFEAEGPNNRLSAVRERALQHPAEVPTFLAPHAYQTVDEDTLRSFGLSGEPFSMHVAETELENELTSSGTGAIAQTFRELGVVYRPTGKRLVPTLDDLGLLRPGAQFVHCCAINSEEVELLARRGAVVAHCPRSNTHLNCPAAPIREMLDAGIRVGLGLDSPASSGPIDMFAEMRTAREVALDRRRSLDAHEIWRMATDLGADSLRFALPDLPNWRIEPGSNVPLIKLNVRDAYSTNDLIDCGSPDFVEWI